MSTTNVDELLGAIAKHQSAVEDLVKQLNDQTRTAHVVYVPDGNGGVKKAPAKVSWGDPWNADPVAQAQSAQRSIDALVAARVVAEQRTTTAPYTGRTVFSRRKLVLTLTFDNTVDEPLHPMAADLLTRWIAATEEEQFQGIHGVPRVTDSREEVNAFLSTEYEYTEVQKGVKP